MPRQVPLEAVSVLPCVAVPEIVGTTVLRGAVTPTVVEIDTEFETLSMPVRV